MNGSLPYYTSRPRVGEQYNALGNMVNQAVQGAGNMLDTMQTLKNKKAAKEKIYWAIKDDMPMEYQQPMLKYFETNKDLMSAEKLLAATTDYTVQAALHKNAVDTWKNTRGKIGTPQFSAPMPGLGVRNYSPMLEGELKNATTTFEKAAGEKQFAAMPKTGGTRRSITQAGLQAGMGGGPPSPAADAPGFIPDQQRTEPYQKLYGPAARYAQTVPQERLPQEMTPYQTAMLERKDKAEGKDKRFDNVTAARGGMSAIDREIKAVTKDFQKKNAELEGMEQDATQAEMMAIRALTDQKAILEKAQSLMEQEPTLNMWEAISAAKKESEGGIQESMASGQLEMDTQLAQEQPQASPRSRYGQAQAAEAPPDFGRPVGGQRAAQQMPRTPPAGTPMNRRYKVISR